MCAILLKNNLCSKMKQCSSEPRTFIKCEWKERSLKKSAASTVFQPHVLTRFSNYRIPGEERTSAGAGMKAIEKAKSMYVALLHWKCRMLSL